MHTYILYHNLLPDNNSIWRVQGYIDLGLATIPPMIAGGAILGSHWRSCR